jgi:hypothetical protein
MDLNAIVKNFSTQSKDLSKLYDLQKKIVDFEKKVKPCDSSYAPVIFFENLKGAR